MQKTEKSPSAPLQQETKWREIICRGIESDTLDYKSALDWRLLSRQAKAKFVRHCIAFANTRGGMIVIGVAEDESGRPVLRTGLTAAEAAGFDPSTVGAFINSCVDPPIDLVIHRPEIDGKVFAVIEVKPFRSLPHVCTKGIADELNAGVLYIRTADASSRPAYRSGEIHELLIRALRLQREELGRLLKGLLFGQQKETEKMSAGDRFAETALHGREFFRRRKGKAPAGYIFAEFTIRPAEFEEKLFSINDLRHLVTDLPEKGEWYTTNTALRYCAGNGEAFGQLSRAGFYQHICRIPATMHEVKKFLQNAVRRGTDTFSRAGLTDCLLGFSIQLHNGDWQSVPPVAIKAKGQIKTEKESTPLTVWHRGEELPENSGKYAEELTELLSNNFL